MRMRTSALIHRTPPGRQKYAACMMARALT
ncbi:hypothetical protein GBAR_LOCUS1224 [Geodia barretti]|uniref:Uncharacterized protein n=1 Tax=Geodia barretti TaxID=519541 RepID=A0AA35QV15_GEOBA|nr:hypothetical protein GBAR_LOCUS1224 [Geodia barretti]